jgi:hypothetical protein
VIESSAIRGELSKETCCRRCRRKHSAPSLPAIAQGGWWSALVLGEIRKAALDYERAERQHESERRKEEAARVKERHRREQAVA